MWTWPNKVQSVTHYVQRIFYHGICEQNFIPHLQIIFFPCKEYVFRWGVAAILTQFLLRLDHSWHTIPLLGKILKDKSIEHRLTMFTSVLSQIVLPLWFHKGLTSVSLSVTSVTTDRTDNRAYHDLKNKLQNRKQDCRITHAVMCIKIAAMAWNGAIKGRDKSRELVWKDECWDLLEILTSSSVLCCSAAWNIKTWEGY